MSSRKLRTVKEIVDSVAVIPSDEEVEDVERIKLDMRKVDLRVLKASRDVINDLQEIGLSKSSAIGFLIDAGCIIYHSYKSRVRTKVSEIDVD